jgi:uncharacterized protein (TIGR02231 family)
MPDSANCPELTPITTEIVAVTVYSEQARITRQAHIEVAPSTMVLEITALPTVLQADTIQAYAEGTAQVTLQKPVLEPLKSSVQANESALINTLHEVEDAFRRCKDTLAGLSQQQSFLMTLAEKTAQSFAEGLSQQGITLEAVAQFLDFFERTHQQISDAIATHERQKSQLDSQLQVARTAVQQFEATPPPPHYRILIPITVKQAGTVDLRLIYDVTQAHWSPVYDVRLERDHHALEIDCIAEIQQTTGEAWTGVDLRVSTATPENNPEIPDPSLLRIQPFLKKQDPEPDRRTKPTLKSRSRVLDDTYRMLGALPGSEIPSPVDDDGLDPGNLQPASAIVNFQAIAPAYIPSDAQPHRIPVGQLHLDNEFTYIALPQRHSAPYLCTELTNPPDKWPLLPGQAYLFRANGYVGEVEFNYVAPGESFQLSLGLDERVTVQRELVTKATQNCETCIDLRAFRLSIHNPFTYSIVVTVLEQIPVSRMDDIKIKLVQTEPIATVNAAGQCQWMLQLAAQETCCLYYQYAVEHPADVPISGLE